MMPTTEKLQYTMIHFTMLIFIGLSFERSYLMEGLNLMIAKSADFGKNRGFQQKLQILQISKTVDFGKPRISM